MKTIIKNTVILLVITLVAGLALAAVHDVTEKPIETAQENAKLDAYKKVFPEADSFGDIDADLSGYKPDDSVKLGEVKTALDKDKKVIGWVMTLTSPKGYGGDIKIAIGVKDNGTLNAMTVLEMSETAGLGAKCTSEEFQAQFSGIRADSIGFTKTGEPEENEIDAISGATYTTTAVVQATNAGLKLAHTQLMDGANAGPKGGAN